MASSVQSIRTAPQVSHSPKVARSSRNEHDFAASLKIAQGGASESSPSPKSAGRDISGTEANVMMFELDAPITNTAVADVVAKVVRGGKRSAADKESPRTQKNEDSKPADAKEVVDTDSRITENGIKSSKAPDTLESDDANIAVTYDAPGEAKAIRCSFPLSKLLAAGEGAGEVGASDAKPISPNAVEPEKAALPASGELVFQLSLQPVQDLPALTEGGDRPKELDSDEAEFPPAANDAIAAIKSSIAEETEQAFDEGGSKAELSQEAPQTMPSSFTHEATRDGLPLPQSSSSLGSGGRTATTSEHTAPPTPTTIHTEHATPLLTQLPATAVLQRMDVILRGTDQVVRLDIRQSHGSVKVAVHSDDAALAVRLRDSLPELLNRLDDRGLQARVTSLGSQSTVLPMARTESGNTAGKDTDGSSRDTTQQQQHKERNPHRAWRAATWKLHEE